LEQPDASAPVAVQEPPAEPPQPPVQAEDDIPEAVEVSPGEKMVPLGAVVSLRQQLKQLKPLAEKATQLEQTVNEMRPYVDFLRTNQHLLQPQQPPAAPPAPAEDPELVELARTLELYDPKTGQPDTARAAKVKAITATTAQAQAQQLIERHVAPLQATTNEQRAAANLQTVMTTYKDASGRPLDAQFVAEAVSAITAGFATDAQGRPVPQHIVRARAVELLAQPAVMDTIASMAMGRQAMSVKPPVAAPATPPLHVEAPGGGQGYVMGDSERRLAGMANIPEKQWAATASSYKPGRANSLED